MPKSPTRRLVVVVAAVVITGGCRAEPAPGAISRRECSASWAVMGAECGAVPVPENRRVRGGRTIDIAFVRLRGGAAGADPVVLLPGGPGQAGTGLAGMARALEPLRDHRDILLIDLRGTGASNPLDCPNDVASHPAVGFGHIYDPARVRACRPALERVSDVTQYTADRTVEDIDEVRAALGYQRLRLWGGSYGTRIALTYMQRFPEQVAAAVLDGAVPPGLSATLTFAASLERSMRRTFARCRDDPRCDAAFPSLEKDLQSLSADLRQTPMPATVITNDGTAVPVRMSAGDFGYAVRGILYTEAGIADLPRLVHRAARSRDLSEFAQRYWRRAVSFTQGFADGLHLAMLCADDVPGVTEADIVRETSGTLLGRHLIDEYRAACTALGVTPQASARAISVMQTPTLIVTGEFDPGTPPSFADRAAASLPRSRRIVAPGAGHVVTPGCVRAAVLQVLSTASIEGLPAVCGVQATTPPVR